MPADSKVPNRRHAVMADLKATAVTAYSKAPRIAGTRRHEVMADGRGRLAGMQ